jgi:CRP-like cAMP-binding protein
MIRKIIQSILPISNASCEAIENLVEYTEYEKGTLFIKENQYNSKEYFIFDGICRSFLYSPEGEEITISFFSNKSILSPYMTRVSNRKSSLNFQALTQLELGVMDASKFEMLMVENPEIREFGNTVLRNELKLKVEKEISLASTTASERLLQFRKEHPMFENLIPHPTIASYLGITNVSLSRLRRELMQKD